MKLALIFLFAILVVSHQQIPHRMGLVWLSPYLQQRLLNKGRPFVYNNYLKNDEDFFFRQFGSSRPVVYSQDQELNQDGSRGNHHYMENVDYPDTQSRVKGFNRPSFLNRQQDPRFFFGTSSTFSNPFLRTATFTLTSTINLTNVKSCIAAGDFLDDDAQATNCRRRRDMVDFRGTPENVQFSVNPSKMEPLTQTLLPSLYHDQILPIDNFSNFVISSSKREVVHSDDMESLPQDGHSKEKRYLLNYYVASTTVTTYSFLSTTVTKTVDLGIDNGINCLPAGYVVC